MYQPPDLLITSFSTAIVMISLIFENPSSKQKSRLAVLNGWMGYTLLDTNYVDKWTN
ncbi:hypothetical protein [Spiroplasma endosymbiont of Cleonymus obscurus]|uniref:hypothetical protein n=1 Tax=Spiroplasma endosymbiont of Cleonymus obscurus TaxID=3066324 RepID=UPI0037DC530A